MVYFVLVGAVGWMLMQLWSFFFFKQKTAYEMRISDWSSDVCSSDLVADAVVDGTLLGVLQDLVGLVDVLEGPFRLLVARIAVRVPFHRELAVALLQRLGVRALRHAEDVLIFTLRHTPCPPPVLGPTRRPRRPPRPGRGPGGLE